MNASNRVRIATAVLSVLIAALLMGAVDRYATRSAATPPPVVQSQAVVPMIGVATGEFQNGVPVYRLPTVTVTETRSQALARFAREDALAMKQLQLMAQVGDAWVATASATARAWDLR